MNDNDSLRARLAAVREGDRVSVTIRTDSGPITITGPAFVGKYVTLYVGAYLLTDTHGNPYCTVLSLDSHTPAAPPEPEGDALVKDGDGDVWVPRHGTWWNRNTECDWTDLVRDFGPVTVYVPREKGEDRD